MWPAVDQIVRVPLAPLLVAQGLGIRRRVNRLPEPPGPREGHAGQGKPLRLLIVGDSSAAGVGAGTQEAALSGQLVAQLVQDHLVSWKLLGETSATTKVILGRLSKEPAVQYDVVVSALGVNDVTRASSRNTWMKRQEQLAEILTSKFGAQLIVASGLPPMGAYPKLPYPLRWVLGQHAKRLDHALAETCQTHPTLTHLPIDIPFEPRFQAEDGYHPSEKAYALWAKLFAEHIRAHWR